MNKILIIEDDLRISTHLSTALRGEGFGTEACASATEARDWIGSGSQFNFVILDRLLGYFDAKELVKPIKAAWPDCPILVLSAINTPDEKASLLDLGVDDYVAKPFSTQELISRVNALLRRSGTDAAKHLKIGNVVLDVMKRSFTVNGKTETPPPKEFLVLRLLSQTPGRVLSRGDIFETVWDGNRFNKTNVVEATIAHLRRRLEEAGANITVKNMRNSGYWIEVLE